MIYLLLSILVSSFFVLAFKFFEKFGIENFQAGAINYIVASSLGFIINRNNIPSSIIDQDWLLLSVILGIMFISMINIIAITTQKIGVSVASVATKTSLVIPVISAIFLYGDKVNAIKIIGILLAISGVYLATKKEDSNEGEKVNGTILLFPVILFFATGSADAMINHAQKTSVSPDNFGIFVTFIFAVAAIAGSAVVLYQILIKKQPFQLKSIIAGASLGIINYGTLYFLMKALDNNLFESSIIFPINNLGVVIFSTLFAFFLFKEVISKTNWLGIILSGIAISLIAFS